MLIQKHFIAGEWRDGEDTFEAVRLDAAPLSFPCGNDALVDSACQAANKARIEFATTSRADRAAFLEKIAEEIEARASQLTEVAHGETALPIARLEGERGRTTGQLRLFADYIRDGAYLDHRHDEALPDRAPAPRPDLKTMQRPIGPVAVFGASNFPLAFSVAGGDTASALAAGCPVVVKGHEAHPGTSEIVAQAIEAAVRACGMPMGTFSLVHGGDRRVGAALVTHPLVQGVGFTGSLTAGRALFDLCATRDVPIPFFGELGSINPIFIFPAALAARGQDIAKGWAASLTMGAGQFCTNPGVAISIDGPDTNTFADAAAAALEKVEVQTMLTDGIAASYRHGNDRVAGNDSTTTLLASKSHNRDALPCLYEVSGKEWLKTPELHHEVFGPLGLLVRASDLDEMRQIAATIEGQLTCTLHLDNEDTDAAVSFMPILEQKAGRLLANGFPTGVEVAHAMVHGGPYPASTNFGATSVGTMAIRRWLRPVCYQNMPDALLPNDLRQV